MRRLTLAVALLASGCALFTPKNIRTLLDLAETTCIVAHQDLPDADVAKACGLAEPFFEPMRNVLASSRQVSAKAAVDAAARQRDLDVKVGVCRPEKTSTP